MSIIITRNSSTSGSKPSTLYQGELAINVTDGKLYYGSGSSNIVKEFSGSGGGTINTGSLLTTASFNSYTSSTTSTFAGTASYAISASWAPTAVSSSNSLTASYVNPLNQTVIITGSLNITGSTTQIGTNNLFGNTTLSGSIIISGSTSPATPTVRIYGDLDTNGVIRFDPVTRTIDNSISASYIYASGSTQDLYFTQNGQGYANTTRLRWLEGNLYTGLLSGGVISSTPGSTTFNVSSGSGIIVSLNAATASADPYPTIQYVKWPTYTGLPITNSGSAKITYLSINSAGSVAQQTVPIGSTDTTQWDTQIELGVVLHLSGSVSTGVYNAPQVAYGSSQRADDFIRAFGPVKVSGHTLQASGSSPTLSIIKGSGTAYNNGANYVNNPNHPSVVSDPAVNTSKIYRYYISGSTPVIDTGVANAGYTAIDSKNYVDTTTGTLTTVGAGYWSIQRVFWIPNSPTNAFIVYYGNARYGNLVDATNAKDSEPFIEAPNTAQNAIFLGYIIIQGGGSGTPARDLLNANEATIIQGGLFRNVGGIGSSGTSPIASTFAGLSDVSVASRTNGDLPIYNGSQWANGKVLTGNYSVNGNLTVTGSIIGTASLATTASYTQNAQSASYVLNAISASQATSSSFASTASYAPNYVLNSSTSSMLSPYVLTSATSSMSVATASFAVTASYVTGSVYNSANPALSASYALTASYATQALSASYAPTTPAFPYTGSAIITGSLVVTGSGTFKGVLNTSGFDSNGNLSVIGTDGTFAASSTFTLGINVGNNTPPYLIMYKSNGGYVATSMPLGVIQFKGVAGSTPAEGARITAVPTATWGSTSYPTALTFNTVPVNTTTQLERMRVDSTGYVGIGVTAPLSTLHVAGTTLLSGSFNTATSGSILKVVGSGSTQPIFTVQGSQGELFSVTDSLSGSLFSVNDISGLPILEVFSDNTTLVGNYQAPALITTAKNVLTNSGSFTVYSIPTASYDGAFFDYTAKSGSNARAGQIMAIWSGTSVNYTETTTTDFGTTSGLSLNVSISGSNMVLTGSASTTAWTIKTIVRSI